MEEAGLQATVDALGNMRGRRDGREDLAPVMIGSHLDTVPEGGHFDGVAGLLAALEVVRALNDRKTVTRRPLEIVNFSAEESSRFGVATLGSKAMTGKLAEEDLDSVADSQGRSLRQVLLGAGLNPDNLKEARLRPGDVHAFLELHIEQGPILEDADCPLGIVTAIAAPTRFRVFVAGRADHSGTTPMGMRRDALAGASELVLGVERIAAREPGGGTVATVGWLRVAPGVMNVVPAGAELGIDIRDIDQGRKQRTAEKIVRLMKMIAERRSLEIRYETMADDTPTRLPGRIVDILEKAAGELHIACRQVASGAGHDAMNMAAITEAGLIFVPSIGGISHNVAEKSRMEDICRGAEVLLKSALILGEE